MEGGDSVLQDAESREAREQRQGRTQVQVTCEGNEEGKQGTGDGEGRGRITGHC